MRKNTFNYEIITCVCMNITFTDIKLVLANNCCDQKLLEIINTFSENSIIE